MLHCAVPLARIGSRFRCLRRWSGCRRRLVLGRALGLDALGHEASVFRQASLNQCLRLVYECVGQRIVANVTDRQRLAFSIQDEIDAPRQPVNTSRLNRSADTQPVTSGGALQIRQLGNRVVVRLAFAVAEPRQKGHRHNDDADADPEFRPSLQSWYSGAWYFTLKRDS